jgi:hypothetical protein
MVEGLTNKLHMLLCQKARGVQQRRIEQQHLLQVYRKAAAAADHLHDPQEVEVALQTEEEVVVVHIPDERKKLEWTRIEWDVAYPHSAVCCVLSLCLMKLNLLLLKLCLYFGVLLSNDH